MDVRTDKASTGKSFEPISDSMKIMLQLNEENGYEDIVRQMAKLDSNEPISNGQPDHAAILYQVLLERSKKQMLVFCNNFKKEVFDQSRVLKALRDALDRGVVVRAVSQETPEAESRFLEILEEYAKTFPDQVSVKCAASENLSVKQKYVRNESLNFCVSDQKALRWEPDRNEVRATAYMNNPKIARSLVEYFQGLFAAI